MKIERLPAWMPAVTVSDLSEYELYEFYDNILETCDRFRSLYIRRDELPDLLIEAEAFRLGCVDRESGTFGWCPWEISDPAMFPRIRRFIEQAGQTKLAEKIQAFEVNLSSFDPEAVSIFFGQNGELPRDIDKAISSVVDKSFSHSEFSADVWLKTARSGAELLQKSDIFFNDPDSGRSLAAICKIIDLLPDYESREPQETTSKVDLPFHQLLVSVGERYYQHDTLKSTNPDGTLSLTRAAQKFASLKVFSAASQIHRLTSTKREWLCCKIDDTFWLVSPTTGDLVSSAPGAAVN